MDDSILYLLLFVAGFYAGWKVNDVVMRFTFGRMMEEAGVTDKDLDKLIKHWKPKMEGEAAEQATDSIEIKIEKHGEMLYAFKMENDEFIGQGKNREELLDVFRKRFNNVTFTVSKEHGFEYIKD